MKAGDIVMFTEVLEAGDEDQQFVVLNADDTDRPGARVLVRALGTGFAIPPVYRHPIDTLRVVVTAEDVDAAMKRSPT
jgi:hypothetical protein